MFALEQHNKKNKSSLIKHQKSRNTVVFGDKNG